MDRDGQARTRTRLAARGDVENALAALERARNAFEEIGSPYEAARCVMAASRLPESPKALAETARMTFARLGAADVEG